MKNYDKTVLGQIPTSQGQDKTLADLVALNIGQIGENILLSRAATISANVLNDHSTNGNIKLAIVTHPSANPCSDSGNVAYGRFGVIVAYSKKENVGMVPEGQTVGKLTRFAANVFKIAFKYYFCHNFVLNNSNQTTSLFQPHLPDSYVSI